MEELLIELMNRGFLIYQDDRFILHKIYTPADERTITSSFDSFDDALNEAKRLIDWQRRQTALNTVWLINLMYRHRGLGVKSIELGRIDYIPYDAAKSEADERAVKFIEKFEKGEIESWEVKITPQKKSTNKS